MVTEEVVALLRIVDLDGMDLVEFGPNEVEQRQPVLGLAVAAVLAVLVVADLTRIRRVALPERQVAGALMQRQQPLQQRRAGACEAEHEQRAADLLVEDLGVTRDEVLERHGIVHALEELPANGQRAEQRQVGVVTVEPFRPRRQRALELRRPVAALVLALRRPHLPLEVDGRPHAQRPDQRAELVEEAQRQGGPRRTPEDRRRLRSIRPPFIGAASQLGRGSARQIQGGT